MNMIFPGIEPVIDEKGINVEKFDELFNKAVAQQPDGFFAFTFLKPGETDTIYLFVVNGHPYGAGMIEKGNPTFFNVKEFFDVFSILPGQVENFVGEADFHGRSIGMNY